MPYPILVLLYVICSLVQSLVFYNHVCKSKKKKKKILILNEIFLIEQFLQGNDWAAADLGLVVHRSVVWWDGFGCVGAAVLHGNTSDNLPYRSIDKTSI